jgi:nitrate/nitrite transport system permease protein
MLEMSRPMDDTMTRSKTPSLPVRGSFPSEAARERIASVLLPVLAAALLCGLWLLYSHAPGVSLPGPDRVLSESKELILHPFYDHGSIDVGIGWQLLSSLKRVAMGYTLAVLVGVGAGLLIGSVKVLHKAFDPIFQVLRTIPPLAWLPIALATFNQAAPSAVFVIFITAVWPILLNTAAGVQNIPKDYTQVAQVYRVRGFRYFWLILLPATAPFLFTGLRIGIGLAWLAIVAAEMLTGGVGIGFFLWDCWNSGRLSDIFVAVASIGLVGLVLDRAVAGLGSFIGAKPA